MSKVGTYFILDDHAIGFVNPPKLAGLNFPYRKKATGGRENIKSVKNTAPAFDIPLLLFSDRFGSPSGKKHWIWARGS